MEYILLLVLGIVLIVTGIYNLKGNISMVHGYNRRRVSKEDTPKYGYGRSHGGDGCSANDL